MKKSNWDLLPYDVIYRIYQFKHQLDMKDTLRTIERFKYRRFEGSNVFFNCVSSIKELLHAQIITKKLYICLKNYNHSNPLGENECYFRMSLEYMCEIARKLDITIRPVYECFSHMYPLGLIIKYNKSRLISLIEMIELLALLKISFVSDNDTQLSVKRVFTTQHNRRLTLINLDFEEIII